MIAVGVNASAAKCAMGNQYQYCAKSAMPTIAGVLMLPPRPCRLMVTLRPPASSRPCASVAPNLAIASSCFSVSMRSSVLRTCDTRGLSVSFCCTSTMASAMHAPWRTKSTGSLVIGSSRSSAASRPVPAHAMPSAIAAP